MRILSQSGDPSNEGDFEARRARVGATEPEGLTRGNPGDGDRDDADLLRERLQVSCLWSPCDGAAEEDADGERDDRSDQDRSARGAPAWPITARRWLKLERRIIHSPRLAAIARKRRHVTERCVNERGHRRRDRERLERATHDLAAPAVRLDVLTVEVGPREGRAEPACELGPERERGRVERESGPRIDAPADATDGRIAAFPLRLGGLDPRRHLRLPPCSTATARHRQPRR